MENSEIYDIIILGGGPAGLTAGLYAARSGRRTLLLEGLAPGGQMARSSRIENYPGFPEAVDGVLLARSMETQARKFGLEVCRAQATSLKLTGNPKCLETDAGDFLGRAVILAGGSQPRRLNLPGEERLTGRGVHYCAACDGFFYRGKTVAVVGGGNSAAGEALHLAGLAKRVILVHRRDSLRAERTSYARLLAAENVEFRWNSEITCLLGEDALTGIRVRDSRTGMETEISCDGLFVSIGRRPATELLAGQLALDEKGYLPAGETTETETPGVFAAGDIRAKPLRQIITAAADGAVAAQMAEEFLSPMR